jgi:hypothetical protein
MTDGVNLALELVLEEISAVEAQLIQEGMLAFQNSRHQDAERLAKSGKQLQDFSRKLGALKGEWSSGIDIKTRKRVKVDSSHQLMGHTKGDKTNLRITLANGRVIQRPTAVAAMVDAIEMLGVEQVIALGLRASDVPLIGTKKSEKKYCRKGQKKLGKWLVCTHSNTISKKKLLEQIGEKLGQEIQVEII